MPYHPIENHGIIGDLSTVALVAIDGTIDFMNRSARRTLGAAARRIQDIPFAPFVEACLASPLVHRRLLSWRSDGRETAVALRAAAFRVRDRALRIVSFQDIRPEIEETELGSWLRMMRVLNHEIMNSVTPIVSLASTAARLLEGPGVPDAASMDDIGTSVRTIERRGKALLRFAAYHLRNASVERRSTSILVPSGSRPVMGLLLSISKRLLPSG